MIEAGGAIPPVPVKLVTAGGITDSTADAVLGQGKVVMFAVPGAFTPTCHVNHLPGFVDNEPKFRAAGVDRIVCVSANDQHVLKAWGEATGALGKVDFMADGNGVLAEALGLAADMSGFGMGTRYRRSAAIIENGIVRSIFVEGAPGVSATGAPAILMALEASREGV